MRLFPRDEKFFDLLEDLVQRIVEASKILDRGVRSGAVAMALAAGEIKQTEHEADQITHQLFTRLNSTFVTPLDPEDLHALGASLDDVLDYIEEAAFKLTAYRIDPVPVGVEEITTIILASCTRLQTAIGKLKTGHDMNGDCIEINRLENQADDLVRRLMTDLFNNETNAVILLKHKEIYEVLESATDRCEDAADVLQTIVVKNS